MSKWETTVDELIVLFGDSLRALIPVAERARMAWKEPNAYDDWDHICEAIYRSIVISSVEHADGLRGFLPMLDYDRRTSSYEMNSFIGETNSKGEAAFVCFETETSPFDRCVFAVLDGNLSVISERRAATAGTRFSLYCRQPNIRDQKSFDRITVSI
ncbi:hypothetical protein ACWAT4_17730 [Bradyrhizobium manausense]